MSRQQENILYHLPAQAPPSWKETLGTWARIGFLSFGGPTAQIALMHRVFVEEKKWLTEPQYLSALSFCMLLPGPEAMQLATYVGWRLQGWQGGLAAGLLFVLPGAVIVLLLSMIYAAFGATTVLQSLFLGIKSAVLVIVLEALIRISKRALKTSEHWIIAGISFVAIFFFSVPFPLLIFLAAVFGFWREKDISSPNSFKVSKAIIFETLKTSLVWLLIWWAPLFFLAWRFGSEHILTQLSLFFSKLAVVTFGGAYAVLAYMAQDVVTKYSWLSAGAMMDGLGLAETTPGPLILVTEFVGYLAAYNNGGDPRWGMGLLGAFVALWATFVPCFLWIFAGAPYIEWITHQPRLKGALAAITATVVGVICNLTLWFALHVFFKEGTLHKSVILKLWLPDVTSLNLSIVGLSLLSGFLLFARNWSLPAVISLSGALGLTL